MSKIVILVIVFNIVTALIANYNKKKKLEAERNGSSTNKNGVTPAATTSTASTITTTIATSNTAVTTTKNVTAKTAPPKNPPPKTSASPSQTYRGKQKKYDDDDHARTVADSDPGRDVTSAPGIAAVEFANSEAYVTRDPSLPTTLSVLRNDIVDADALRRAFILKTVLDKPLTLKTHQTHR